MFGGSSGGFPDEMSWPYGSIAQPPEVHSTGRRKMIISGIEGKVCAPWASDRLAPIGMAITKHRKSAESSRTPEACTACKRIKKKCDDLRPCSRCVRLGRAGQCTSWTKDESSSASTTSTALVVQRPVSFSATSRECDPDRAFPKVVANHDLVCEAILKVWSFGLRLDSVVNIFNSIPSDVFPVVKKFFTNPPSVPQLENGPSSMSIDADGASGGALVDSRDPFAHISDEDSQLVTDAERWESDEVYGFLELVFDPGSTKLWRNVGMNARYAEIHGYHKEELLARYANHDAELQRTERDALFFFLFTFRNILNGGGPSEIYSRIVTGSGDAMRASLVWLMMGNVLNRRGQLTKLTVLIKTISAAEYDEAVRRTPEACVLYAMGDRRCGQQLLDEIHTDAARAVADLGRYDEDEDLVRRLEAL